MALLIKDEDRQIIPRWRDFWTTVALGELAPTGSHVETEVQSNAHTHLASRIADWQEKKTTSFAADLVAAATVVGDSSEDVRDAARFLLSEESKAPRLPKMLAFQIIAPDPHLNLLPPRELEQTNLLELKKESAQQIRRLKRRLLEEPRNSILLVDIARHYTVLGVKERAKRAMRIAVEFGSENRFVLRAAARLYVHQNDPEQGQEVLKRANVTQTDPWLLAAEIGVASKASKSSSFIKRGYAILDNSNYSFFETAELASALATIEMIHSNIKGAKKLFRRALKDPTENSVAQAEWAARHMLSNFDDVVHARPPRIYEARAWEHYEKGEWQDSFQQSLKWLYDQPFSEGAILFSSFLASTALENHDLSARILEFGRLANPEAPSILNNLVFALASAGRINEARSVFDRIDRSSLDQKWEIVLTATEGLLRYREGFPRQGWELYSEAIQLANNREQRHLAIRAAVYRAREELLGNFSNREEALRYASHESHSESDKLVSTLLGQVERLKLLPPKSGTN